MINIRLDLDLNKKIQKLYYKLFVLIHCTAHRYHDVIHGYRMTSLPLGRLTFDFQQLLCHNHSLNPQINNKKKMINVIAIPSLHKTNRQLRITIKQFIDSTQKIDISKQVIWTYEKWQCFFTLIILLKIEIFKKSYHTARHWKKGGFYFLLNWTNYKKITQIYENIFKKNKKLVSLSCYICWVDAVSKSPLNAPPLCIYDYNN